MTGAGEYPQQWEADVLLRDGRPMHLRPIKASDGPMLRKFHDELSAETIYFRFFAPHPQLSDQDVERFTHVDYLNRMAFVATRSGEIAGIGSYDRVDDTSAEVAFTVRDDFQGVGLGSVLLEHIAAAARERGFEKFVADVLPSNQRMIGTFREAGYTVSTHYADGVIALEFDLVHSAKEESVMRAREHASEARSVAALLSPEKIAVIGVSRRPESLGQVLVRNLRAAGFPGSIYAIHPEVSEVAGIRAFATVAEAPGPIDLAIVTAPIDSVTQIVSDCAAAHVRALVIISSAFSPFDPQGEEKLERLVTMAREGGMRVVGPEALGIINTAPRVDLNASLADIVPGRGRIGFFCESGTLGATFLEEMRQRELGIASFVSPGMRIDVSSNDLLQYWESDDSTSVVLLYLQELGNVRKFNRIVRRLARRKPVVAVLSGASRNASGELSERVVSELLAHHGVLLTNTIGGLLDASALLAMQPLPQGERVALVSNSTALLSHTMDLAINAGLSVVPRTFWVPWDANAHAIGAAVDSAIDAGDVDSIIVMHVPPVREDLQEVSEVLRKNAERSDKPIVAVLPHKTGLSGRSSLVVNAGVNDAPGPGSVPIFGEPAAAVAALGLATKYSHWLSTAVGDEPDRLGIDDNRAHAIIDQKVGPAAPLPFDDEFDSLTADETRPIEIVVEPRVALTESETVELLGSYGLELWPRFPVTSEEQAVSCANEIGYPVVLKLEHQLFAHRLELGGIRLNLENERALRAAYLSLTAQHPREVSLTMTIQAMAPAGVPCVITTMEDRQFGPIVRFAIGGHVADVTKDWAYAMAPLTDLDAHRLLRAPKSAPLLFGYGGVEPVNVNAVAAVLMRVAQLAMDFPQLRQLTINPLLATPSGCYLLGARIELTRAMERLERQPRRMTLSG